MSEVFYWILNMSITAVFSGLVILLIRKIKIIPKRFVFVLWGIPFLRMIVPVGMSYRYSLMTLMTNVIKRAVVVKTSVVIDQFELSSMNSIAVAKTYSPVTYKTDTIERVFDIGAFVWIAVSVILLLIISIAYVKNISVMKKATHYKENIYLSGDVDSPCVIGIFKPRILLNDYYDMNNLEYVIAHEKAHIRNVDNLWKILAVAIVIVHWFNPFAWLFLKNYFADMERACDERVIARLGANERKAYALTLLNCVEKRQLFAAGLGGGNVRARIENILSFKKMTVFSALVFVMFCVLVAFVLLTNAA